MWPYVRRADLDDMTVRYIRQCARADRAEQECTVLAARVRQLFAAQDVITGVASSLAAAVDAEQAIA